MKLSTILSIFSVLWIGLVIMYPVILLVTLLLMVIVVVVFKKKIAGWMVRLIQELYLEPLMQKQTKELREFDNKFNPPN